MKMIKEMNFDVDGTFCGLYNVDGWLEDIINHNERPYVEAKPIVNMNWFARTIHELQADGWKINIISWLAKNSDDDYDERVRVAKLDWFKRHLPSVEFDDIKIVKYGTCKGTLGQGILFDDEEQNRREWNGLALDEKDLIKKMRAFL